MIIVWAADLGQANLLLTRHCSTSFVANYTILFKKGNALAVMASVTKLISGDEPFLNLSVLAFVHLENGIKEVKLSSRKPL